MRICGSLSFTFACLELHADVPGIRVRRKCITAELKELAEEPPPPHKHSLHSFTCACLELPEHHADVPGLRVHRRCALAGLPTAPTLTCPLIHM